MHFLSGAVVTLLGLAGLSVAAPAPAAEVAAYTYKNSSREFKLETKLRAGQAAGKAKFGGLFLEGYHSGAGLNDAVFTSTKASGLAGFLNHTAPLGKGAHGQQTYPLLFLIDQYPYDASVVYINSYTGWSPVHINGGQKPELGGYFMNATGLQWTTATAGQTYDEFGGWLVCQWWRGVPQLFALMSGFNDPIPSSCAKVLLMPKYL